ncbi:MAG: hypothetical protein PF636_08140, partial [Actinomycetota bacterium]|nr:hypothetical protein [Actinomycetota bacterium]
MGLTRTSGIRTTRTRYAAQRAFVAAVVSILFMTMCAQNAFAVATTDWPVSELDAGPTFSGHLDVSDQLVVWAKEPAANAEIFVWTEGDTAPTRLTNDTVWDTDPHASGDRVVWVGGSEILTWAVGDTTPTQVTNGDTNSSPQISGNRIVWASSGDIFTWRVGEVSPTQVTSNGSNGTPQVSGDRIAWTRSGEVYTWAVGDVLPTRLTSNDLDDCSVQISGSRIVWTGESYYTNEVGWGYSDIYTWAAGDSQPTNVTNHGYHPGSYKPSDPYRVYAPQVSGDRIVWHERNGFAAGVPFSIPMPSEDSEIYTWETGDA